MSRSALLIIMAAVVAAVAVGVVVAAQSASEGKSTQGRQLNLDLNENLALKGNP